MKKYQFWIIATLLLILSVAVITNYFHDIKSESIAKEEKLKEEEKRIKILEEKIRPIRAEIVMNLTSTLSIAGLEFRKKNTFENFQLPDYMNNSYSLSEINQASKDSLLINCTGIEINPRNGKPISYKGMMNRWDSMKIDKIN